MAPGIAVDQPLFDAVVGPPGSAQRRAMAKAITMLESTRPDHRARADALLNALLPASGNSFRLGISGVPGVGKSTFIEALGLFLIGQGHRVAVLAVDPSSSVSGGSILGDKTRMEQLSVNDAAYIRPSPASGTLGGVAEKTREAMRVCEAAGYDVVIVETVGVGQSEIAVAGMTDMFVLLQLPNAGDDLQAIKKGVMELADLVVINKADIDEAAATRARAQITSALRLVGMLSRSSNSRDRCVSRAIAPSCSPVSKPILSTRFGISEIMLALPQRSPRPLIVPCTWRTPARTAASVLATAFSVSLCVWMPSLSPGNFLQTSPTMRSISCGRVPPLVSQSTSQRAPFFSAAARHDIA